MLVKEAIKQLKDKLDSVGIRAVDLGADGGVCEHWLPFIELMTVDAFEPNKEACEKQRKKSSKRINWHDYGLAKETGTHILYVPKRTTGASLYEPNTKLQERFGDVNYWGQIQKMPISCLSFDDFLRRNSQSSPELIKLDTQGTELDILRGLTQQQLSGVLAVEIEVEFLDFYLGQPLFSDVNQFMEKNGFELIDLRTARSYYSKNNRVDYYLNKYLGTNGRVNSMGGHLVSGDALYFRKSEHINPDGKQQNLIKLAIIAIVYRYYDYALCILESALDDGLIDELEFNHYILIIKSIAPRVKLYNRSNFIGKIYRYVLAKLGHRNEIRIGWMKREWPNT
jgi:FkbM family methyltransferase